MLASNQIYQGDCLEIMQQIDAKSIDMILCDLPYGTTKCHWDSVIPFDILWEQYKRITKPNTPIVLFAKEPFTSALVMSNVKQYRQKLTWLKTRPTNVMNAKKQFMNWTEDILIFYEKLPSFTPVMRTDGTFTGTKIQRMNTNRLEGVMGKTGEKKNYIHKSNNGLFYPKTVLEFSNVNKEQLHPTQKPLELCEYLIKTYSNENDLILDNCCGSGTTCLACKNLNRNFIGIEKEKKYVEIAKQRLNK